MNDDDVLNYGKLIDDAMHQVVRKALLLVQKFGLYDDHHFFITFSTNSPGVMISDELKERYPDEMTIVIQHQYWDLEITDTDFSIVLSFGNIKQNLTVPFDSLVSFADPSVKFGLQFQYDIELDLEDEGDAEVILLPAESEKVSDGPQGAANNVVALDSFRNKK